MSNKPVLAVFFLATVGVAAGSAWAAGGGTSDTSGMDAAHAAVMKDFGKLSADGAKGFQDLTLARLAIYDGKTDQAKTFADAADAAFAKTKGDDSAFMKAETDLMTGDQVKARKMGVKPANASVAKDNAATDNAATKDMPAAKTGVGAKVAWLPVDGALSVDEDYTMSPAKARAVGEANKNLAKGDRKGALDQLKLADVSTSVVLEVVPRDATIADVHQAAQMIDAGKYYEGSQMLRKVQMTARYDVTDVVGTPKAAASASSAPPAKDAAPATH